MRREARLWTICLAFAACTSNVQTPKGLEDIDLDLKSAEEVDPGELYRVVEGGVPWDARDNRILQGPIVLRFGMVQKKATRFDFSFDRTDTYELAFLLGDVVVGHRFVEVEDNHGSAEGLWRSDYSIPKSVRKTGFDRVYIAPPETGDGKYAVGHFKLIEDVEEFKKKRKKQKKRE